MIQKLNNRPSPSSATSRSSSSTAPTDNPEQHWGSWVGTKHYELQVIQHPIRARMCGFGDKDRRPLAPAAVAKMIVRREDNSLVDVDDIDFTFFVVTVDLWSADGKREMNLVLHPSSADRYVPTHVTKPRRRGNGPESSAPGQRSEQPPSQPPSASSSASRHSQGPYSQQGHPPAHSQPPNYPDSAAYPHNYPPPDSSSSWGYPGPHGPPSQHHPGMDRASSLPSIHSLNRPAGPNTAGPPWHGESSARSDPEASSYQAPHGYPPYHHQQVPYGSDPYAPQIDTSTGYPNAPYGSHPPGAQGPTPYGPPPPSGPSQPPQQRERKTSPPLPMPRHTYTRTLVGPLSANACRLNDEHRKPGIFFLFQDLSIRTEGTFRLRMRLMNIGSPPAPEPGATRVMSTSAPILAQTLTEPFTVYSAKRFPGVPDTTALSIAFGNQGQKLPLRNRHGARQQGRRRGGHTDSEGSGGEDSE